MGFPNLVLPFSQALIAELSGRVLAVRVTDPADIVGAAECVKASANRLSMVILDSRVALDEIPFDDSWAEIKLAVFAPQMGQFRGLVRHLHVIRELGPTIYLSTDVPENLTALRILSSINVKSAAVFGNDGPVDWEGLTDLMTYALTGAVAHGPIEPFSTIAGRYRSAEWIQWGPVFFDDPKDFFHLDPEGRVALSARELAARDFIQQDIRRLDEIIESEAYRQSIAGRRRLFLEYHHCSRCPGWPVCLGRFSPGPGNTESCAAFAAEIIAILDELPAHRNQPVKERHDHRHL